ncbi:PH domain-containing protein [Klebsiella oxytoca]|uniref:PH domain-containing protein n=1 Tax=Klebsiella oxytoca TaxID=571 RepID=A0AAP2FL67_KLEOX|nr:PH domain-containing protein [Klebsiella oxytoca]MBQ0600881.1 PH domain-containing protein [Klebsiella oxytoca]
MTDQTIAVIRPSQVLNLPHYLIWMVIGLLLFVTNDSMYGIPFYLGPVVIIIWRYLVVHCIRYEITTERIRFYRGVLNRKMDETELYRVRDYSIRRPFYLLIFRLAILHVDTQDIRQRTINMVGIRNAENVLSALREQVEASRARKGVRDIDIGSLQ